jgi:DnaJ-domain-containing protein 1
MPPVISTDYFALLDQPRRPWIETEALKQKFLSLSAEIHPDRVHNADEQTRRAAQQRYAELNAAHSTLINPRERLRHLIELETGRKPAEVQQVPARLANFFFEIAQTCRAADAILNLRAKAASSLAKAQLFERSQDVVEELGARQQKIGVQRENLLSRLKDADAEWLRQPKTDTDKRQELLLNLEQLYRLFSYCDRWAQQLQERIVQLAF